MVTFIYLVCALTCLQMNGVTLEQVKASIYKYTARTITSTNANDQIISQWILRGNVIIQHLDNHAVMKLDKLKTSMYNGPEVDMKPKEEDISEEAQVLQLPVVVHYNSVEETMISHISVLPEDPEWSVNMKRAICSNIQFRSSFLTQKLTEDEIMSNVSENNVYGKCQTNYTGKPFGTNNLLLTKTLIHNSCRNDDLHTAEPYLYKSEISNHLLLNRSTERIYIFTNRNTKYELNSIQSISIITYSAIPQETTVIEAIQYQEFDLLNITTNEPIDMSRHTVHKNLTFEHGNDYGTKDNGQLYEEFMQKFNEFKGEYDKDSLEHVDGSYNDTVADLIELLTAMNYGTLRRIIKEDSMGLFLCLLPYVETEQAVKLTNMFLTSDSLNHFQVMDFLENVVNKDMLANLVHFVDINTNDRLEAMSIINFASLVAKANERKLLSQEEFMKYVDLYLMSFNNQVPVKDYGIEMSFLLGLINLADGLSIDTMIDLALNTRYSRHLRSLATYGFKKQLIPHPELVFDKFWPTVQNNSEHLEVRVASLDLLLCTNLTATQLYMIIDSYNGQRSAIHEQHLQIYIYTTLQSLQNITGYQNSLYKSRKTVFENFKIPEFPNIWTTGNYLLSYTDSAQSFGTYYQVRFVADPDNNLISSVYLSYDGFALSTTLDSYTVYIKLEGISQYLLANTIFKRRLDNEFDVPELIEMIKRDYYQIKQDVDVQIEIVIFVNGRAVYTVYYNRESLKNGQYNELYLNFLKYLRRYNAISFPVKNTIALVSDLGTYVEVKSERMDVMLHEFHKDQYYESSDFITYKLTHKSSSKVEESIMFVSPVHNARFGARKIRRSRIRIDAPIMFDITNMIIKWQKHKIIINMGADRSISTYVRSKQVLAKYCPSCILDISELRGKQYQQGVLPTFIPGLKINISIAGKLENAGQNHINKFEGNYYAFPFVKIILIKDYFANYFLHGPSYEPHSISIVQKTLVQISDPTESSLKLNLGTNTVTYERFLLEPQIMNMTVTFIDRNLNSDTVRKYWNTTFNIISQMKNSDSDAQLQNHIQVDYKDQQGSKMCIDYKILHPKRPINLLSQTLPESTSCALTISTSDLNKNGSKTENILLNIAGKLSCTDEQNKYIKDLPEYKLCQNDSVGFRYVPPTQACSVTSQMLKIYPKLTVTINNKQNKKPMISMIKYLEPVLETFLGVRLNSWRSKTINASVVFDMKNAELVTQLSEYRNKFNYSMSKYQIHSTIPRMRYDNMEAALDLGLKSTCVITSNFVKTFTGRYVKYEKKVHTYTEAFIECLEGPRVALTFRKLRKGKIGFKLWTDSTKIIIFVANDSMVVSLNGDQLKANYDKQTGNVYLKVYFLGENELYIVGSEVEVYFNTEYISIQVWTPYTELLCGICSK